MTSPETAPCSPTVPTVKREVMEKKEVPARVATFKLAAALEEYEVKVRALAGTSPDLDLLQRLQHDFGELRLLCASLPKLSVSWVAVLVSHARLLPALCSRAGPAATALLQEHLAAIERLRNNCLRLMGAQGVVIA